MNSFTTNYNLDLYDVDDKPNLNDQYNDAMHKVDNALHGMSNDIVTAETAVNNLSTKVDGFDARITANANAASTAQTTAETAVDMSQKAKDAADAAQNAADAAQSAADTAQSAADAAQGDVNTLKSKFPINANDISPNAVTSAKIATGAVTGDKIANAAVGVSKLGADVVELINTSRGGIDKGRLTHATYLCIGDSYAQAEITANTWPGRLASILGGNATVINAAVSGGGFTTATTFQDQIVNKANTMNRSARDAVDCIIIAGGRNDIGSQSENTLLQASMQTVVAAASNFKNAIILLVPMLWDAGPAQSSYDYVKAAQYMQGGIQAVVPTPVIPVDWAWTWLKGNTGAIQTDGVHPNQTGATIIAKYMLSALTGSYSGRTAKWGYADNNINLEFIASCSTVHTRSWAGNSPAFPSGGISNAIPKGCRPYADLSTVGYTNSGTSTGIMQFTRSGTFNIYNKSGNLGGVQGNTSWIW